jgi:hypothetical protein
MEIDTIEEKIIEKKHSKEKNNKLEEIFYKMPEKTQQKINDLQNKFQ